MVDRKVKYGTHKDYPFKTIFLSFINCVYTCISEKKPLPMRY